MPRRGHVPHRDHTPDPVFQSESAARFINKIMMAGNKSLAQRTFYRAMDVIRTKTKKDPLETFELALKNVMPLLEVKPRRVGGSTYQVPMEVRSERRVSLGMRWLVQYARRRSERTMVERLAGELMEAAAGAGGAVKRREELHRTSEANKAFAHYRW